MKLVRLSLHDGSTIVFGPGGLIIGPALRSSADRGLQTEVWWGGQRRLVREALEEVVTAFEAME